MRIYSPSQTMEWLTCPVKRQLHYREKLVPRLPGKREAAGTLGQAVATGLAVYNTARGYRAAGSDSTRDYEDIAKVASHIASEDASRRTAQYEYAGCIIREDDRMTWDAIPARAAKIVTKFIEKDPIPPHWRVAAVEETLPEYGFARPDLVLERPSGGYTVVDYKVKLSLDTRYREREMRRWRHSWQLLHYVWAAGQVYGPCSQYHICMIRLEPSFSIDLEPFEVHPEDMLKWEASARRAWAQMEAEDEGRAEPWMAAVHADNYGDCEYYGACFEAHWEPALMERQYARLERKHAS